MNRTPIRPNAVVLIVVISFAIAAVVWYVVSSYTAERDAELQKQEQIKSEQSLLRNYVSHT